MATIEIVKAAILALKDRTGSSIPAINKWIESEKKVSLFTLFIDCKLLGPREKKNAFFAKNSVSVIATVGDIFFQGTLFTLTLKGVMR